VRNVSPLIWKRIRIAGKAVELSNQISEVQLFFWRAGKMPGRNFLKKKQTQVLGSGFSPDCC